MGDLGGKQSGAGVRILMSRWSLEGNVSMDVLGTMNAGVVW